MLRNPFVLIGQGFVAGAILFHFTAPGSEAQHVEPVQSASNGENVRA